MYEKDHTMKIADGESYAPHHYDEEEVDGMYDPVELMKHDTKRHKDILKKRAQREGKGKKQQ